MLSSFSCSTSGLSCLSFRYLLTMTSATFPRIFRHFLRRTNSFYRRQKPRKIVVVTSTIISTSAFCTYLYHWRKTDNIMNYDKETGLKRRSSETRFIKFASAEYNGQIYMTPLDFIESLLEAEPRKRHKRLILSTYNLDRMKEMTPNVSQSSSNFFRALRGNGIISYTDYLFLLSVLTKPKSGFDIAFKMTDLDGSGQIDKHEYLEFEKVFSKNWKSKRGVKDEDIFDEDDEDGVSALHYVDDEAGLQRRQRVDTTLVIHFFGEDGKGMLDFNSFTQFMVNLQNEVLELEFSQFAHGLSTITEVDFAKILLRYTYLDTDDYDDYIDRLLDRFEDTFDKDIKMIGITFDEFRNFILFLNNLNDFKLAMKMYTIMNTPITKAEFQKAVLVCTGHNFSQHLVDTIFAIFDLNGDGYLSCREFLFVMKDRLHRGYRKYLKRRGFEAFKTCMTQEFKHSDVNDQAVL